ncbi:MAG: SMC-Scp complex subunit ScpB, partial [Clostridia bacterium]|nr:SMC-Scp complex subunit ScpB [Clostridia bacterium]
AYNQPVTRSFIEQVRGVDCSGVVSTLVEKGLIEERGRLELPGRPLLYGTTKTFLRSFSLNDLSDLPPLPKDNPEVNDVGEQLEIAEELVGDAQQ